MPTPRLSGASAFLTPRMASSKTGETLTSLYLMTLRLRGGARGARASLVLLGLVSACTAVLVRAGGGGAGRVVRLRRGHEGRHRDDRGWFAGDTHRVRHPAADVRRRARVVRRSDDDEHRLDRDLGRGARPSRSPSTSAAASSARARPGGNLPEIEIATALGDAADRVVVYGTEGADHSPPARTASRRAPTATSTSPSRPAPSSSRCTCSAATTTSTAAASGRGAPLPRADHRHRRRRATSRCCEGAPSPTRSTAGRATMSSAAEAGRRARRRRRRRPPRAAAASDDRSPAGPAWTASSGPTGTTRCSRATTSATARVNGGPGVDTAHLDVLDPAPVATETVVRPAESCEYDGATRALTLTMTPRRRRRSSSWACDLVR